MGWISKLLGEKKQNKILEVEDDTFEEDVLKSDMPVLVDFWAPWCAPCQVMGGLLRDLVPEFSGRLRIAKLNLDYNPQTAGAYGVRSIPTVIIFKNGRAVDKFTGLVPLNTLRQKLERHALPQPKEES
ncbi:thioredoxin [bacterium]|nr:thioredoxin [bacterium]